MRIRREAALGTLALSMVGMVAAYHLGRARADGVPMVNPLFYGGMVDDGGRPLEGTRNVTVRLWDAATAGATVCTTTAGATAFSAGRFRVALDSSCVGAVRANPELWAELQVDTTTFPRSKLGAVPYALEAGRATSAAGALGGQISALEARVGTRQFEIGSWTFDEILPDGSGGMGASTAACGGGTTFTFQSLNNPATLTFVAASTALYRVSASAHTSAAPRTFRIFSPSISAITPSVSTSVIAGPPGVRVVVSSIFRLTAGQSYSFSLQMRSIPCTSGTGSEAIIYSPITAEQLN